MRTLDTHTHMHMSTRGKGEAYADDVEENADGEEVGEAPTRGKDEAEVGDDLLASRREGGVEVGHRPLPLTLLP